MNTVIHAMQVIGWTTFDVILFVIAAVVFISAFQIEDKNERDKD